MRNCRPRRVFLLLLLLWILGVAVVVVVMAEVAIEEGKEATWESEETLEEEVEAIGAEEIPEVEAEAEEGVEGEEEKQKLPLHLLPYLFSKPTAMTTMKMTMMKRKTKKKTV